MENFFIFFNVLSFVMYSVYIFVIKKSSFPCQPEKKLGIQSHMVRATQVVYCVHHCILTVYLTSDQRRMLYSYTNTVSHSAIMPGILQVPINTPTLFRGYKSHYSATKYVHAINN